MAASSKTIPHWQSLPYSRRDAHRHLRRKPPGFPQLCRFASRTAEIPRRLWTKKNPRKGGTKQSVDGEFRERVKGAQDDVERDPRKRKPARPVVASKQKYSAQNCGQFRELNPHRILVMCEQLPKMSYKADCANRQIDARENRY
jgi:hypothetical protein